MEVPPCERDANVILFSHWERLGEGKSDRSADASGVRHTLPSPFQKKCRATSLKKRCCSCRKPDGNGWGKTSAVIQVYSICLFGRLSFLMRNHLTGMPAHACFVLYLTPTTPLRSIPESVKQREVRAQESGRHE